MNADVAPLARKDDNLRHIDGSVAMDAVMDAQRAVERREDQRVTFRQGEGRRCAAIEPHIPDVYRGVGSRRSAMAGIVAGDDAHQSRVVRQVYARDVVVQQRLIARRNHFMSGREIDP